MYTTVAMTSGVHMMRRHCGYSQTLSCFEGDWYSISVCVYILYYAGVLKITACPKYTKCLPHHCSYTPDTLLISTSIRTCIGSYRPEYTQTTYTHVHTSIHTRTRMHECTHPHPHTPTHTPTHRYTLCTVNCSNIQLLKY